MEITALNQKIYTGQDVKIKQVLNQFNNLIVAFRKLSLPDSLVAFINQQVENVNAYSGEPSKLGITVKKMQTVLLKRAEKEAKIVPKNYYRNLWMVIGMSAFGIPLGVALGASLGNMAFLGLGLPIGMPIGMALGSGLDKKAKDEGRQLDIEIKG